MKKKLIQYLLTILFCNITHSSQPVASIKLAQKPLATATLKNCFIICRPTQYSTDYTKTEKILADTLKLAHNAHMALLRQHPTINNLCIEWHYYADGSLKQQNKTLNNT